MKFTANETGGNFSETAYGSALFAQYEFNLFYLQRGNKHYELTNHLGNVLTVISDKRLLSCMGDTVQSSFANIVSATDYSPFGAPLAGRTFSAKDYRFGFNGQERDDEVSGAGNTMTAEFWEYESRLGRRWNLDPKPHIWVSDYSCFGNNPEINIDPDGDYFWGLIGSTQEQRENARYFASKTDRKILNIHSRSISVAYTSQISFGVTPNFLARIQTFDLDGKWLPQEGMIYEPQNDLFDDWEENSKTTYDIANSGYLMLQGSLFGSLVMDKEDRHNLNGTSPSQIEVEKGTIDGAMMLIPGGREMKILSKINAAKFSQIFKGNLAKMSANFRGVSNRLINKGIDYVNKKNWGWFVGKKAVDKAEKIKSEEK